MNQPIHSFYHYFQLFAQGKKRELRMLLSRYSPQLLMSSYNPLIAPPLSSPYIPNPHGWTSVLFRAGWSKCPFLQGQGGFSDLFDGEGFVYLLWDIFFFFWDWEDVIYNSPAAPYTCVSSCTLFAFSRLPVVHSIYAPNQHLQSHIWFQTPEN